VRAGIYEARWDEIRLDVAEHVDGWLSRAIEHAGDIEDRMDLDFKYLRATPEKALLDWIYLGASARTKISGPPFDIDADRLQKTPLQRLAKAMNLESR
jgi:hypothetical protein